MQNKEINKQRKQTDAKQGSKTDATKFEGFKK